MIRKIYDSLLKWSEKRHSLYALSGISFLEASIFPIPPDPLLIALSLGKPKKAFTFAFFCSFFSVLGAVLGYYIGSSLWEATQEYFFNYLINESAFEYVETQYRQNSFVAILTAAFTPVPFKVFTIAAGAFKVSLISLITASALGRSARFFLEAGLIYFYGPKIKDFIDKYFNILTVLITIVIIGIIIIYKML